MFRFVKNLSFEGLGFYVRVIKIVVKIKKIGEVRDFNGNGSRHEVIFIICLTSLNFR